MAPRDTEHCENCLKHCSQVHYIGGRCDRCLNDGESLRRCGSCKLVRYCGQKCQRAHWKQHRSCCQVNVDLHRLRDKLDPALAERQTTFEKWCGKNSNNICSAALSALEVMRDQKRIDTYVFLVYVDVVESRNPISNKLKFVRSVRTARSATMLQVHEMLQWRFAEGQAHVERYLAPRPGVMRILAIDDGLPIPFDTYTLPTVVDQIAMTLAPFNADWLPNLKRAVEEDLSEPLRLYV